jgi:hypothetical protein
VSLVLDNPFFARDARHFGRREFAGLCRWLTFQSAFLLVALFIPEFIPEGLARQWIQSALALPLFFLIHWISCYLIGVGMGNRLLFNEHQKRTLEGLQLVARSPWRWVPEKLLFSFYGLVIVWAAGLPFYWMIAVRGVMGVSELSTLAELNFLPGCVGIGQMLLSSPESWPGMPPELRRRPLARWIEEGLPPRWVMLQLWWYTFLSVIPWGLGFRTQGKYTVLFGHVLSGGQAMGIEMGLLWAGAMGTAWATANPGGRLAGALARVLRMVCLVGLYLVWVASLWPRAGQWERIVWVAALPAVLAWTNRPSRRGKAGGRRRAEDRRAEGEVQLLQRGWDNPLFVRDLRALLRPASLATSLPRALLEVFAAPIILAGLTFLVGPPAADFWREWFDRSISACAIAAPAMLGAAGLTFAGRVRRFWEAERLRGTLPQLLNAPLGSAEIVGGRWAAGAVRALPFALAALLCAAVGVYTVAQSENLSLVAYVGLLGICAFYGVGLGGLVSGIPMPVSRFWHFLILVPVLAGPLILLPSGVAGVVMPISIPDWWGPSLIVGYMAYPLLALGSFWTAVRNIEWLRRRDSGERQA